MFSSWNYYYYNVSLLSFGFTKTDADVFDALVSLGPSTGYAVAKRCGIARANTYQSLEALTRGGLVEARRGRPVIFAAHSPDEVVATLETGFRKGAESLSRRMTDLAAQSPPHDTGAVEQLDSVDLLLDAASRCASASRRELLAVVSGWAKPVFPELERAALRGVACRLLALGNPAPHGAAMRVVPDAELVSYWGGSPLVLVADGHRAVCAVHASDGRATGVYAQHAGLVPFLRHLLRRELSAAAGGFVS